YTYSSILAVTVKKSKMMNISILSVKAQHDIINLSIKSPVSKTADLLIADMQGRLLYKTMIVLNKGVNVVNKPVSLSRAVYIVKIATDDALLSQKFIKE
ncbi:MAG TPA: T9SS type A sorting domain-containing protein, partial [Ferruginibacter sp.]|nr:T9SS type A sorting domain-containing protein [Ferruginibacter sp.]